MAEERITEHTDARGNTHTTRTIETGSSSGGTGKWVFLLILVVAFGVGVVLMTQAHTAEVAKDNAIADAAGEVGEAAGQVGDAAQEAAQAVNAE